MISAVMPVRIDHAWQIPMTTCAIDTLLCTASENIEVVIVERGNTYGTVVNHGDERVRYFQVDEGSYSADWNAGADRARGDLLLHTGNDVFVRPGWAPCLLECFKIPDCGVATVMSSDLSAPLPPPKHGIICEGVYGPFMAFDKRWRLDAKLFPNSFSDTDLVMRVYGAGLHSYRHFGCTIHHLNKQTLQGNENDTNFANGREAFLSRHQGSPHFAFRALSEGVIF